MNPFERAWALEQARYLIEAGFAHLIVLHGRNPKINRLAQQLQRIDSLRRFREQAQRPRLDLGAERLTGRIELVDERGHPL